MHPDIYLFGVPHLGMVEKVVNTTPNLAPNICSLLYLGGKEFDLCVFFITGTSFSFQTIKYRYMYIASS